MSLSIIPRIVWSLHHYSNVAFSPVPVPSVRSIDLRTDLCIVPKGILPVIILCQTQTSVWCYSPWAFSCYHVESSSHLTPSDWQQLEVKCEYKSACGRAKREVLFFNSKIKSSIYIYNFYFKGIILLILWLIHYNILICLDIFR